jgi:SAM-dependent methyltransferase
MKLRRRLMFYLWYLGRPPWDTGVSPPELLAFLDGRAPGRAIDLGCGTGTNVRTLAQRGWRVLGVDFAANAIQSARHKIRDAGLEAEVRVGDVTRLTGISGPFEFALDLGCFHGLSGPEQISYLDRLQAILAPGGRWMLYARLRSSPDAGSYGLLPADLERIQAQFQLISRQDGFNRSRKQPAVYLLLQRSAIRARLGAT